MFGLGSAIYSNSSVSIEHMVGRNVETSCSILIELFSSQFMTLMAYNTSDLKHVFIAQRMLKSSDVNYDLP